MKVSALRSTLETQLRKRGVAGTARKTVSVLSGRLSRALDDGAALPLRPEDIADSTRAPAAPGPALPPGAAGALDIGWVCTPPGPRSGGHTTLFRMVEGMERLGHRCSILLYDPHSDDVSGHEELIRHNWPSMRAEVRGVAGGFAGLHAVVASSWQTAHVVATRAVDPLHRFYFIQDYEPYFYPRGSLYALAEDSYRLGLGNIALGGMVAAALRKEVGLEPVATVPFGCDTAVYRLLEREPAAGPRRGVVMYAKEHVDRRGFVLAKLALGIFHEKHPDQPIHIFGDVTSKWPFPVVQHGSMAPAELNRLYNTTIAGLSMSFTNISLTAEEMLAAGTVAVVNDSPMARADLHSRSVRWAQPTPNGLAEALSRAVTATDLDGQARSAAASVTSSWSQAQHAFSEHVAASCGAAVPLR